MVRLKYFIVFCAVGFAAKVEGQTSTVAEDTTYSRANHAAYTGATDKYGSMGVCIGTPAYINLVIGRSWNRWGFRVSGIYLGGLVAGAQGNLVYNFYRRHAFSQSLSLAVGYGVSKNFAVYSPQPVYPDEIPMGGPDHVHWSYAGIAYNWNWGGFFFGSRCQSHPL